MSLGRVSRVSRVSLEAPSMPRCLAAPTPTQLSGLLASTFALVVLHALMRISQQTRLDAFNAFSASTATPAYLNLSKTTCIAQVRHPSTVQRTQLASSIHLESEYGMVESD